jgi:hypothetical protein
MNRILFLTSFALLFALALPAADVTGTWTGQMPTRGGETREVTFKLKQAGSAVTGAMSAFDNDIEIKDGKIDGDNLAFTVTLEFGDGIKLLFTGTVKGNEIQMTRQREGTDEKQSFVLKRS